MVAYPAIALTALLENEPFPAVLDVGVVDVNRCAFHYLRYANERPNRQLKDSRRDRFSYWMIFLKLWKFHPFTPPAFAQSLKSVDSPTAVAQ